MRHAIILLLLSCSATALIAQSGCIPQVCAMVRKAHPTYKQATATLLSPKARTYRTSSGRHSTTHYVSQIQFRVDTATILAEVERYFLYFESKRGDKFTVFYDSTSPRTFEVYQHLPLLGEPLDSTVGKVTSVSNFNTFKYTYRHGIWLVHGEETDAYDDQIYNTHPDVVKGRRFRVIYQVDDTTKAIMLLDQPADRATFRFRPHNNMIGISVMPLTRFSLTYSRILGHHFALGLTFSGYYDPLHTAKLLYNMEGGHTMPYHNRDFMFKPTTAVAPNIRWYIGNHAPLGFYVRLQGYFMRSQGITSNYITSSGFPKDSTTYYFQSLAPENRSTLAYKAFNTWGLGVGIGGSFFVDDRRRWVMDFGWGFKYINMPKSLKDGPLTQDGATYYYHASPVWPTLLNIPVYFEWNLHYKF